METEEEEDPGPARVCRPPRRYIENEEPQPTRIPRPSKNDGTERGPAENNIGLNVNDGTGDESGPNGREREREENEDQ